MTEITTERCVLQPLTESDESDVLGLVQNIETRRFLGGPVFVAAVGDRFVAMLDEPNTHHWAVRMKVG